MKQSFWLIWETLVKKNYGLKVEIQEGRKFQLEETIWNLNEVFKWFNDNIYLITILHYLHLLQSIIIN